MSSSFHFEKGENAIFKRKGRKNHFYKRGSGPFPFLQRRKKKVEMYHPEKGELTCPGKPYLPALFKGKKHV